MRSLLLSLFVLLINITLSAQEVIKGNLMIAPLPVSMEVQQGSFVISPDTWIMMRSFNTFSFDPTLAFREVFKDKSGYTLHEPKNVVPRPDVIIKSVISVVPSNLIPSEGYELKVSPSGITILAS
ncbi:MAG TPA: glycoside hydrolase family 20 zincin-like fold domain-containing protein, partial [Saprospiraceae bacterium]|nr:glycoside hydrolase family 20 zincin-like fold domain-containing protein [Saprospiraceae bacterium]